jgi:tetratricopeptide (TPR) repeat protein
LKRLFFVSAEEFQADRRGYDWPRLRFGGLCRMLGVFLDIAALRLAWREGWTGADAPSLTIELDRLDFRAAAYLEANPDLAYAGSALFRHFVAAGFEEGRRLEASAAGWEEVAARMADIRAARPDGRAGYAGASLALARLGRGAEADALLGAALDRFGEMPTLLREYARSAMHQELHDAAMERWGRLRVLVPDDAQGYQFGALACRLAGDLAQAEAVVQTGLALFPDDANIRVEQATIASQLRHPVLAQ